MTDSLRTRIAAAIMHACHGVYMDDAVDAADVVLQAMCDLQARCDCQTKNWANDE